MLKSYQDLMNTLYINKDVLDLNSETKQKNVFFAAAKTKTCFTRTVLGYSREYFSFCQKNTKPLELTALISTTLNHTPIEHSS